LAQWFRHPLNDSATPATFGPSKFSNTQLIS
jgi:hypothetical protein